MANGDAAFGALLVTWIIRVGGLLLIGLGLILPWIPRNRFSGIRFGYTLADDEVWQKVHSRFRWAFLFLGLLCFWPLHSLGDLVTFTVVLMVALIGMTVWSYLYARRLYVDKFGTTEIAPLGFFRYGPPDGAAKTNRGDISGEES